MCDDEVKEVQEKIQQTKQDIAEVIETIGANRRSAVDYLVEQIREVENLVNRSIEKIES